MIKFYHCTCSLCGKSWLSKNKPKSKNNITYVKFAGDTKHMLEYFYCLGLNGENLPDNMNLLMENDLKDEWIGGVKRW